MFVKMRKSLSLRGGATGVNLGVLKGGCFDQRVVFKISSHVFCGFRGSSRS